MNHDTSPARLAWRSLRALLVAAVATSSTASPAQPSAPPAPVEAYFARPDMERPRLSPSGRHLAALVPGQGGRNALAVLDLSGGEPPRLLAQYSDADVDDVRWVDDEWLVYDVQDLQAGSGEYRIAPGLFSVSRRGGDPRKLVKVRGGGFIVDGAAAALDRRLEYNHRLLFVPRDGSREVVVGELDLDANGYIAAERPLRLNVETGRRRAIDLGRDAPARVQHWMFDADGRPRLALTEHDGRTRVHWRDGASNRWDVLLDAASLQMPWEPHAVGAAGTLYVTHPVGAGATRVLTRFDFDRRAPADAPIVVVPGFDFDGELIAEHDGARVLGVRTLTDGEMTVWTEPALKALQDQIDARLPGRVNRISCRRCDDEQRVVLVQSWSAHDPGTFVLWRHGAPEIIGRRLKAIDPRQQAALAFERLRARDGRELPVWVTLPARADGAPPPPAVVLVHGGPWVRGGSWGWHALPQFLASRGFAVVEPEFRGSTGFGAEHFRAGWRQWGQAMQDDVTDALRWAVAQGLVDGERACIAGGSYGGYAALMGLVREPALFRCGAAWAAVSEPMRLLEGSFWWSDDISAEARRYSLPAMIGDPGRDAQMLKAASPLQQAARIRAPVLLIHGERDRRVPIVHAKQMRDALRAQGQDPEWLTFPDEGHGWRRLENQRAFALRLEAFLARHLRSAKD